MTIHLRAASHRDRREWAGALIAAQKPHHSLDQAFYACPDIFDLEMELLIERDWHFAGLESEVPESGSFMTLDIGRSSIIVCRDRSGELRAFYNSCRHRGSALCDAERGKRSSFLCPYHHWSYDLTGRLLRAPNMRDGLDKAAHGDRKSVV